MASSKEYLEFILGQLSELSLIHIWAENGCLRLMKNLVWEYDALPHALIAGGTGGGKTYFLLTLIEALLHTNAVLYILDPKNGARRFYLKRVDTAQSIKNCVGELNTRIVE